MRDTERERERERDGEIEIEKEREREREREKRSSRFSSSSPPFYSPIITSIYFIRLLILSKKVLNLKNEKIINIIGM